MQYNNRIRMKEDCPIELALLQEADLLDETGLMAIEADCLRLGYDKTDNYLDSYYRHINHAYKELCEIEIVSPIAKKHWDKKKKDVEKYIKELSFDLGIKWEKEI